MNAEQHLGIAPDDKEIERLSFVSMIALRIRQCVLPSSLTVLLLALTFPVAVLADEVVLVEAESFEDFGGWVLDQQFMDQMGSPYLLAHGMGVPVSDATTTIQLPARPLSGMGANQGLGCAVEGSGQSRPLSNPAEWKTATHDFWDRGRNLALAGWR